MPLKAPGQTRHQQQHQQKCHHKRARCHAQHNRKAFLSAKPIPIACAAYQTHGKPRKPQHTRRGQMRHHDTQPEPRHNGKTADQQPRPAAAALPVHHGRVNGNKNHAEMSGVVRYTPNSPKTPPVHQGISGQKTISRNGRQPNIERLCPACQQGHIHTEIYRRKHSNSRQGGGQALVRALAPQVRALCRNGHAPEKTQQRTRQQQRRHHKKRSPGRAGPVHAVQRAACQHRVSHALHRPALGFFRRAALGHKGVILFAEMILQLPLHTRHRTAAAQLGCDGLQPFLSRLSHYSTTPARASIVSNTALIARDTRRHSVCCASSAPRPALVIR